MHPLIAMGSRAIVLATGIYLLILGVGALVLTAPRMTLSNGFLAFGWVLIGVGSIAGGILVITALFIRSAAV